MTKLNDDEKKILSECKDVEEYSKVARRIKQDHGNQYPSDWYEAVLKPGGISDILKERWNDPTAFDLKATYPSDEDIKNGRY